MPEPSVATDTKSQTVSDITNVPCHKSLDSCHNSLEYKNLKATRHCQCFFLSISVVDRICLPRSIVPKYVTTIFVYGNRDDDDTSYSLCFKRRGGFIRVHNAQPKK